MAQEPTKTREDLDRLLIEHQVDADAALMVSCSNSHIQIPGDATVSLLRVFYKDGELRLICPVCGFDVAKVKVGLKSHEPT